MPSYVAFLRAINLGANRKFPKDAIKAAVEGAGFTDVETHINTGNVRLTTAMRSTAKIEVALEDAFLADRGFEVPTMVFTTAEFAQIGRDAEELHAPELSRHYVYLLKEPLTADAMATIDGLARDGHRAVVRGRACHLLMGEGYREGTVDPMNVARHLGVATNRNYNVVTTLAAKWCAS
ncbi:MULTISPECIES: DUF1697 domain-containing protein [unclassified Nocardioides]|uniref:DUF1697 domain-containing protein n=1 Tax=unclassified Nocardioides TaxID=2615069 RepID=UPI0006F8F850|nr:MULTISPECIES: DUF1697 domain-containing protein [unclassified Nocardioides]KQY63544.1 hypothetical protein ASD30_00565 [Nocardioides sp. Root140]KQZ67445.1 hypothetical protein ASD66_21125 [Nocardioides sp. Root151]KRF17505.1 hypothetical protein ASH02_24875 [Nocardioides sp. Soil796]